MPLQNNKNKYFRRTHLSERKFREILKEFSRDTDATECADRANLNRNTINRIYRLLRERVLELTEETSPFDEEVELDESYFGAKRVRGKRGRGAGGKVPVFGILKRGGKVYTQIVKGCSQAELLPIIKGKVLEDTMIYTDGWKAYDGLIVHGYKHRRIHHSHNEFARGKNHINGIESFWSFAKRILRKRNGIAKHLFHLHLKECE
jgi:transposase